MNKENKILKTGIYSIDNELKEKGIKEGGLVFLRGDRYKHRNFVFFNLYSQMLKSNDLKKDRINVYINQKKLRNEYFDMSGLSKYNSIVGKDDLIILESNVENKQVDTILLDIPDFTKIPKTIFEIGLAYSLKENILNIIKKAKEKNITVFIFSKHSEKDIEELSDIRINIKKVERKNIKSNLYKRTKVNFIDTRFTKEEILKKTVLPETITLKLNIFEKYSTHRVEKTENRFNVNLCFVDRHLNMYIEIINEAFNKKLVKKTRGKIFYKETLLGNDGDSSVEFLKNNPNTFNEMIKEIEGN